MEEIPKEEFELTDEELREAYIRCYDLLGVVVDPPDEKELIVLRYLCVCAQRKFSSFLVAKELKEGR